MEIHFYFDTEDSTITETELDDLIIDYKTTEESLSRKEPLIRTTCLSWLSFDRIDEGYDVYVHRNGVYKKMYPGMESVHNKDIRKEHNLMRLFTGGYFNSDFNI